MVDDPLRRPIAVGDGYKPFGELTTAEVQARAEELAAAVGWGPTARIASVARAWSELSREMAASEAGTVADLGSEVASALVERLWVVPPGGSLL